MRRLILSLAILLSTLGYGLSAMAHDYQLTISTRSLDDRIVVRWAPDEYVPWEMCNLFGYRLTRLWMDGDSARVDTLLDHHRPLTQEQFIERYQPTDTLAAAAMQIIYGPKTDLEHTQARANSIGSIMEVYNEQQTAFGMAIIISERRLDVAEAMAMAYVDRDVRQGVKYQYKIESCVPDGSTSRIRSRIEMADPLGSWHPVKLDAQLTDSILPPSTVMLFWTPTSHSAYDIERRRTGEAEWTVINGENPYMSMLADVENDGGLNLYADGSVMPGEYEYRVCGYDLYGERSLPSDPLRVSVPDMIPPHSPRLQRIELRQEADSLMAAVYFTHDTIEADLLGYMPYFSSESFFDGHMFQLSDDMLSPTDTCFVANVTGLPSGSITFAAVDTAANVSMSMPLPIHLFDRTPPSVPADIVWTITDDDVLTLSWPPSPEPDVMYYNVYQTNDTIHPFMQVPGPPVAEPYYVDTLYASSLQPYSYYRVSAVDFAGNVSAMSDIVTVVRPNHIAPQPCRLDSLQHNADGVWLTYIASPEPDVTSFLLLRHRDDEPEGDWTLIQILTPDSVRNGRLHAEDHPEPNREHRYYYTMVTYNRVGLASDFALPTSVLHEPSRILPVTLTLEAAYRAEEDVVTLAWEVRGMTEALQEGAYFSIERMMLEPAGDGLWHNIASGQGYTRSYTDYTLLAGQRASYRITMRNRTADYSQPSPTVTILHPAQ